MNDFQRQFGRRDDIVETRYEDDDRVVFVVDLGAQDVSVDTVDETAIVVAGDDQYEFELPAGEAVARANNGVVTVEVTA